MLDRTLFMYVSAFANHRALVSRTFVLSHLGLGGGFLRDHQGYAVLVISQTPRQMTRMPDQRVRPMASAKKNRPARAVTI